MRLALLLVLVGLVWRALIAFAIVPYWESSAGVAPFPDSYHLLARSLIEERTLGYGELGASPTTLRAPAYPLWLAAGILVGGERASWLGFWAGIPGVLAGVLLFSWATRRHGLVAGLSGFGVAVMHPLPSLASARVMSDDFSGALAFIAIGCWVVLAESRSTARWPAVATTTVVATASCLLTRSSAALAVVAIAVVILPRQPRRRLLFLLLALACVPALLWSARTSWLEGRPVYLHSLTAYNFWIGEGFDRAAVSGESPSLFPDVVGLALTEAGWDDVDPHSFRHVELAPQEAARLETALAAAARRRILKDPIGYVSRIARGTGLFWIQAESRRRSVQYALLAVPVVLLAIAGGVVLLRSGRPRDLLGVVLLAWLLLGTLAHAAIFPTARLSVQYYPALGWLAGLALASLVAWTRPPPDADGQNDSRMAASSRSGSSVPIL